MGNDLNITHGRLELLERWNQSRVSSQLMLVEAGTVRDALLQRSLIFFISFCCYVHERSRNVHNKQLLKKLESAMTSSARLTVKGAASSSAAESHFLWTKPVQHAPLGCSQ